MTELGVYFAKKSINRADVSRKTGIHYNRLADLCSKEKSNLRAKELILIALAIDLTAAELIDEIYKDVKLPS